jgi:hypothetical protein
MKLHEIANQSKQLTPDQTGWLNQYVKGTWNLNANGLVDVEGCVTISKASTQQIPVGFGHVSESFDCSATNITSLAGAPQSVGGNFYCNKTKITSLEGAPQSVGGHFVCAGTKLTSLAGASQSVGGDFNCNNTKITSLVGAPQSVGGDFFCINEKITSLEGAPQRVGGHFVCNYTKITSLAGAPKSVGRNFVCFGTPLVNHLLAFFKTPAIKSVKIGNEAADAILNKYLASADRDMLMCQDELIDAGFGDTARL